LMPLNQARHQAPDQRNRHATTVKQFAWMREAVSQAQHRTSEGAGVDAAILGKLLSQMEEVTKVPVRIAALYVLPERAIISFRVRLQPAQRRSGRFLHGL